MPRGPSLPFATLTSTAAGRAADLESGGSGGDVGADGEGLKGHKSRSRFATLRALAHPGGFRRFLRPQRLIVVLMLLALLCLLAIPLFSLLNGFVGSSDSSSNTPSQLQQPQQPLLQHTTPQPLQQNRPTVLRGGIPGGGPGLKRPGAGAGAGDVAFS
jgi:hypothetical protein